MPRYEIQLIGTASVERFVQVEAETRGDAIHKARILAKSAEGWTVEDVHTDEVEIVNVEEL